MVLLLPRAAAGTPPASGGALPPKSLRALALPLPLQASLSARRQAARPQVPPAAALLLALVNVSLWFLCYRVVKSGWKLRA